MIKHKQETNTLIHKLFALLVLALFINLPLVSAVEISSVQAIDITTNSATIKWATSEPADSFVHYGKDKITLQTLGDANSLVNHTFPLTNLNENTQYYYSVESNNLIDDNKASLYSFQTLPPDLTPPALSITAPSFIAGTKLDITGTTEPGAKLTLFVNNILIDTKLTLAIIPNAASSSPATVPFTFTNIQLQPNQPNNLTVDAVDKAGNKATWENTITTDNKKPELSLPPIPATLPSTSYQLNGTISENSTYEIIINNKSTNKAQGQIIFQTLELKEGDNTILITATDQAGWTTEKTFSTNVLGHEPIVKFSIEKGNNYFEGSGRTTSDISGTTSPKTKVYLFIYTPLGYEFTPKFDEAWEQTTSNEKGEFTFKEVDVAGSKLSLVKLTPKQTPPGLEKFVIMPIDQAAASQQMLKYVYVIAEDPLGRRSDPRQATATLTINKCSSVSNDFSIFSLPQFQAPLRLNPNLLDQGREVITAVFNISYRGQGLAALTTGSNAPYQINNVQFEKACTQGMLQDPQFKLACNMIPANTRQKTPNGDKTSWYVVYNLNSAEKLSEKKDSYWNEFKKRQIVFPMKIRVDYQDRTLNGQLSEPKTQIFCTDLGYYVDIPIDSKDMIPDTLADATIDSTNFVMRQIDNIMPYLETSIKIFGVSCIGSFLGRTAIRWARLFTSKSEFVLDKINSKSSNGDGDNKKDEDKSCPSPLEQNKLLLESTIDEWTKLSTTEQNTIVEKYGPDWTNKKLSLDQRCPKTASLWSAESKLDTLYKWSCDRVFCRGVPARWTASKEKLDVDKVVLAQQQCAASGSGVPLQLMENCQDLIKQDATGNTIAAAMVKKGSFNCYRANDKLYVIDTTTPPKENIVKLQLVKEYGLTVQEYLQKYAGETNLFAYRTPGSENFIVGKDQSCIDVCKNPKRTGYKADIINGVRNNYLPAGSTTALSDQAHGCYKEAIDPATGTIQLQDGKDQLLKGQGYSAGYTTDCFIDENAKGEPVGTNSDKRTTGLLQCVCIPTNQPTTPTFGARSAGKEDTTNPDNAEDWNYQQNQLFRESHGVFGTYYPEWRYYSSRDFSQAFGANYLTDYLRSGKEQFPQVNPKTQYLGAIQTACLSTTRANLLMLRSILQGLNNCMVEAKKTGLRDAGVCKTYFSQHVCGLLYKSIAALNDGCTTYNFDDVVKGDTVGGISEVFSAGFKSIPEAMSSSISDIKSDYGNAKLNEYFATGTQGFAQSLCMAAFGFDWPMGMDFITDAAYSVSTKTTTLVTPASRELSTYDPTTGNAVYNYEIGALIFPGCKVRTADVSLKCVGVEDLGKPGVDCGSQGCDCVQATQTTPFETEKTKALDQGRKFNLPRGQMVDMKLPSPQKVTSHYRYDHVVVDLTVDRFEDAANCFDTEYLPKNGNTVRFYFPIRDVSPPGEIACQVDLPTGRYICPELFALFGGGANAYLEDPYTSCFDKTTSTWVSCDTPNLFLKDDTIRIKNHLLLDGGKYCLKTTVTGLSTNIQEYPLRPLSEKITGSITPEMNLGTVTPQLFSGSTSNLELQTGSDPGCAQPQIDTFGKAINAQNYRFLYQINSAGEYHITIDNGVNVLLPYKIENNILKDQAGKDFIKPDDLLKVKFDFNGVQAHNLVGPAKPTIVTSTPSGSCTYHVTAGISGAQGIDKKAISVTTELMYPDNTGGCDNAFQLVKAPSAYGKNKHTQNIIIQLQPQAAQAIKTLHDEFMAGNCGYVKSVTQSVIDRKKSDLEDAQALYYSIACNIIQHQQQWNQPPAKDNTCQLLKIFFDRTYFTGETTSPYSSLITNTAEYQKIYVYLTEVKNKAGCTGINGGGSTTPNTNTNCGTNNVRTDFAQPSNWNQYTCREPQGFETCYSKNQYDNANINLPTGMQHGCPGTQKCCPPTSGSGGSGGGSSGSGKLCGDSKALFKFSIKPLNNDDTPVADTWKPTSWSSYICKPSTGQPQLTQPAPGGKLYARDLEKVCWDYSKYSNAQTTDICPSADPTTYQLCCPPSS